MDAEDIRRYQRQLVLCCLHRAGEPITATDLHELVLSAGMGTYAPAVAWKTLNPNQVAGMLRSLRASGDVRQCADVRDRRNGRDVPTWTPTAKIDPDFRLPQLKEAPRAVGSSDAYAGLSESQTRLLLLVQDQLLVAAADHRATSSRAASALSAASAAVDQARADLAEADRQFNERIEASRRQLSRLGLGEVR